MNFITTISEKLLCFFICSLVWLLGGAILILDWLYEKFTNHENKP